jgi:hypothetical protein
VTNDTQLQAEFFPGSAIRAQDLNSDFNQSLYIAQETRNNSVDPNSPVFLNDVNFNNHKGINLATPTSNTDAANKGYVDSVIATGAANAAAAAASASAAAGSASSAAASYDDFDDRYLGSKPTDPALDNDGNALITGAIYFNTSSNVMRVYNGVTWQDASANANVLRWRKTAVGGETSLSGADDNAATLTYTVNLEFVYLNGVLLQRGVDYTASNGTSIDGLVALEAGDVVEVLSYSSFSLLSAPSSSITFTQNGSGAVVRTVDSKLKDVVSVKDFGAVGDGVADDTTAIQNAFNAAGAANRSLFFPSGDYRVTAPINTPNFCTIFGEDEYLARITSESNAETLILGENYTHIENLTVRDIRVVNGYTAGTIGIVSKGNLTMTNVRVSGFDKHIRWASLSYPAAYNGTGGGFYYKFINCAFTFGNVILHNLYANNFVCLGCRAYSFVKLADISAGTGNFTWQGGSLEVWTGAAIEQSAGAPCNITVKDNYFEGCGTRIITATQGTVVFENNNIQTFGPSGSYLLTRAVVLDESGSRKINLFAKGNHWWWNQATASTVEYFYFFQSLSGGAGRNCIIEDSYEVQGTGSGTIPTFAFIQSANANIVGVNPITGAQLSPVNIYEQGTWTVQIKDANGVTAATTTNTGYYVRRGNLVTATFSFPAITVGSLNTALFMAFTLPFAANATGGEASGTVALGTFAYPASCTQANLTVAPGSANCFLRGSGSGVAGSNFLGSAITSGTSTVVRASITYRI